MFFAWTLNLDGFQYVILIYGPILDPCGERFNFLIIVHSKKYKRIKLLANLISKIIYWMTINLSIPKAIDL